MISLENNHGVDVNAMVFNQFVGVNKMVFISAQTSNIFANHFRDAAKMVGENKYKGICHD